MLLALFAGCSGNSNPSTPTPAASKSPASQAPAAPATSTNSAAPSAEPGANIREMNFKLSYPNTETSITGKAYEEFAKNVEELSGGKMTVTTYPAGSLVTNAEALDATSSGNVDFCHFMTSAISGTIKEMTIFEIPGSQPAGKYREMDAATHELIDQAFAQYDVKYCVPVDGGTACFEAVDQFIKSPADLNGKTCRSSGTWIGKALTAWGASPVTVALGDIPTALERKTIEVCYAGWIVAGPNKFYETAPFVTWTNIPEALTGFMMNLDKWNGLNDDEKAVFNECFDRYMTTISDLAEVQVEQIQKAVEGSGGQNYILTDAENAAFATATDALIEEARGVSGDIGNQIIDVLLALR
jgi:TRAP-type C4-dicarboxylate transport system substrate-binding protein